MMPGQTVAGRYELTRELGRGGMGAVFEAHDPVLDRDVAIKVILKEPLSQVARERLRREARIVAKMEHPCIVPVYDLVDDDEGLFLVMPVLRGQTLREMLQEGPLSAGLAATIGLQIARALEYSHKLGVIHRDIKPDNIMILGAGQSSLEIKVMDFGVALSASESDELHPGGVIGTVEYLSPEQAKGTTVDTRTDIYSLGALLYECLIGRPPFTGTMMSVLHRILGENPPSPHQLDGSVPALLDALIVECLQKDPSDRPQSVKTLVTALRRVPRASTSGGPTARNASLPSSPVAQLGNQTTVFIHPLAGRKSELQLLTEALGRARQGRLQMVILEGDDGCGKSRLLFELARIADTEGVPMCQAHCLGREDNLPYQAIGEAIRDFFNRANRNWGNDTMEAFAELAPQLISRCPTLAECEPLLRLTRPSVTHTQELVEHNQVKSMQPLLELFARTFTYMTRGRPMVIAMDDLHRAEVSVDVLTYLFRRLSSTPLLIVGTIQSLSSGLFPALHRLIDSSARDPRFRRHTLAPLSFEEHTELLGHLLDTGRVEGALAARLYKATGGNAMFIHELVRALRESGGMRLVNNQWLLPDDEVLPATLRDLLALRLARLAPEVRELLRNAALLSEVFSIDELTLLFPERDDLGRLIDDAVRAGFVLEVEEGAGANLTFVSDIIRKLLAGELSPADKMDIHRRYAQTVEEAHHSDPGRVAHKLAHHFVGARMAAEALRYGIISARNALDAQGANKAIRPLRAALLLVGDDAKKADLSLQGDAHLVLADAYRMAGDRSESRDRARRAIDCFERAGNGLGKVRALTTAVSLAWKERLIDETQKLVERGLEAVRRVETKSSRGSSETKGVLADEMATLLKLGQEAALAAGNEQKARTYANERKLLIALRGASSGSAGVVRHYDSDAAVLEGERLLIHGEYLAALEAFERAHAAHRSRPKGAVVGENVRYLLRLAVLACKLGRYDEAIERCELGRALTGGRDPLLDAELLATAATAYCAGGHFEEANHCVCDGFARIATSVLDRSDKRSDVLAALFHAQGAILGGRGRFRDALRAYEQRLALCRERTWEHATALLDLGSACVKAGLYERASDFLIESDAELQPYSDRWALAHNRAYRTTIHLDHGDMVKARENAAIGLELALEVGDPKLMALLRLWKGRVDTVLRDFENAERHLQLGLRDAISCWARPETTEIHLALALVHQARGRHGLARKHVERGSMLAYDGGSQVEQGAAHLTAGHIDTEQGELASAAENLTTASNLIEGTGNPYRALDVAVAMARLDIERARYDSALGRLEAAFARAVELEARVHAAATWRARADLHRRRGADEDAQLAAEKARAMEEGLKAASSATTQCHA